MSAGVETKRIARWFTRMCLSSQWWLELDVGLLGCWEHTVQVYRTELLFASFAAVATGSSTALKDIPSEGTTHSRVAKIQTHSLCLVLALCPSLEWEVRDAALLALGSNC
eukprot:4044550-Amphidinium_carterae.2